METTKYPTITFEEFEYLYSLGIPISGKINKDNANMWSSAKSTVIVYKIWNHKRKSTSIYFSTEELWEVCKERYEYIFTNEEPRRIWMTPKS